MYIKQKNGISLIVLVITIIVMIILSGATILVLSGAGIIGKTNKAVLHTDLRTMQEELDMYVSNKTLKSRNRYKREELYADKDSLVENGKTVEGKTIRDVLQSVTEEYLDEIEVVSGEITYTGKSIDKAKIANEVLLGVRNHDLVEKNTEEDEIKLEDGTKLNLVNYRIYGNGISLPEEYQQVEYIQTQQDCYIIIENFKRTTFKTKVRCTSQLVTSESIPSKLFEFGAVANNTNFSLWEKNNEYCVSTLGKERYVTSSNIYVKHTIELEATSETTAVFKENEKELLNITGNFIGYEGKITLFNQSPDLSRQYLGKVYDITVWQDDKKVYELIPCYRKADNEIGMYDVVNDVFYTNQGNGEFLKGKDINTVGDYVVDMNFDNKWKQGPAYATDVSTHHNIRVTCENLVKTESGAKYKVSSNLPYNMQIGVVNGTFTTSPISKSEAVYDSGWNDNKVTFTSSVDGNILITVRYKDNSTITPEDIEKYEIRVKKYVDEPEEGGQYVIPIRTRTTNIIDYNKYTNLYSTTTETDEYYEVTCDGNTQGIYWKPTIDSLGSVVSFQAKVKFISSADTSIPDSITLRIWNNTKNCWIHAGRNGNQGDDVAYSTKVIGQEKLLKMNNISLNSSNYSEGDEVWFRVTRGIGENKTNKIVFRVYKDTIMAETSSAITDYQPYSEETKNIYLDEPLRRYGDYIDYLDFRTQEVVRYVEVVDDGTGEQTLRGLEIPKREKIKLPKVMLNEKTNIFSVLTKSAPSKIETMYYTK